MGTQVREDEFWEIGQGKLGETLGIQKGMVKKDLREGKRFFILTQEMLGIPDSLIKK